MPYGNQNYNQVFSLENLLDREEYNTIEDVLSEIKELKDNLLIVLKNNEKFELKLTELEKNTKKEKLNYLQHIDKKFICIFFFLDSIIYTIIKCFSKWTVGKLYINYGLSFDNTFKRIKALFLNLIKDKSIKTKELT